MRFEKMVLLGAAWGLLQTGLILLSVYVAVLAGNSPFSVWLERIGLQLSILASAGISVLVGYWGIGTRNAVVALMLAQFVSFFSFFLLEFLFAPELLSQLSLVEIGLGLLMFLVGVVGSFLGGGVRDWFQPLRTRIVGWKFHGVGLLTSSIAAVLPFYPYQNYDSPVGLWGSSIPIIPFIGALVFVGLISMVFGFRRTSDLSSKRVGLMVLAGLLVLGFSFISTEFTYGASHVVYSDCIGACQDFQIIAALLGTSLFTSTGVIIACLFSDQKEGVAELMGNSGLSGGY